MRENRDNSANEPWPIGSSSSGSISGPVAQVMSQVVERRFNGEFLPDSQVVHSHPGLMPELGDQLSALRMIRRCYLVAKKAGPLSGPIRLVPQDKMEEPIEVTEEQENSNANVTLPSIDGYVLMDEISYGGQAMVYLAIQEATCRRVALKVLAGGPFVKPQSRMRFDREAQILATLEHPHIVRILDRGRTIDGSLFLAMDYIDGYSFDDFLAEDPDGRMHELGPMLEMFVVIIKAVEEAHRHGVIHRDLKPSNIRIDRFGQPHVLDFGFARLSGADWADQSVALTVTQSGQFIGSLPWASPEQIAFGTEHADARSDVYAIGVMVYQALTDKFPYPVHGPIRETLNHIATTVPAAPSKTGSGRFSEISPALDAVVLKALAKSPADRYASAQELADDLSRCAIGQAPLLVPVRPRRRRFWVSAMGVLLVLASLAIWQCAQALHRVHAVQTATLPGPKADFTNSIGMKFMRIPAGRFTIGSPKNEPGRLSDEPEHEVQIDKAFCIGVTEVTQAQYEAIIGKNPSDRKGRDLAVQSVNWFDAKEFCQQLSQQEGRVYRLPKEAEWEYACRAGTEGAYGGTGNLDEMGWYAGNSQGQQPPVAQKRANGWGLYDMHGGVSEWCSDAYHADPLALEADGSRLANPVLCVVRGGNHAAPSELCRSACRVAVNPNVRRSTIGFRIVLELGDDEHVDRK